ncbi:MAG: OstA-like protein [Bacteroidales bacterium]|nr:OstA-like protein [Bacteroidales bacterium]
MKSSRRSFIALCAAALALPLLFGSRQAPRRATFTPQIPTANRAAGNRVFLEKADVLYKTEADSFMVVSGNVEFTKGPMIMRCDSAHYFPGSESFEAFGNVNMQQGDTLFVYADELNYIGPEEVAYLFADYGKKVRMINRDVTLETDVFTYDLRTDVGYYNVGGVLTDKQNRLVSQEGEYLPASKDANFYINVHLNSLSDKDTLDIYTDSLFYNTTTHLAELFSPSTVVNARGTIYTTDGLYDTQLDTAALYARSTVVSPEGRSMTADTIYYDRPAGIGECFGSMVLVDSVRSVMLEADYGFFNQQTDSAYATGHMLIKEYSEGDTLYLHGRQINAYRLFDTVVIPAIPADTIADTPAIPASSRVDTTHVADIFPRVRFYRSDMQGICDSMRVTEADSMLRMYVSPVIWSEERQIFGNIIEIHFNDSTMDRARLPEFGFSSQRVADDFYNQISGKEMIAYFTAGELSRLDINGNVELIMYPEEQDSTVNKMVNAQSSFLTAKFKGRVTEMIKMWPETTGSATPLFLLRKSMLFLPKFRLYNGVRPLSPSDVMIIPREMDELMDGSPRLSQSAQQTKAAAPMRHSLTNETLK